MDNIFSLVTKCFNLGSKIFQSKASNRNLPDQYLIFMSTILSSSFCIFQIFLFTEYDVLILSCCFPNSHNQTFISQFKTSDRKNKNLFNCNSFLFSKQYASGLFHLFCYFIKLQIQYLFSDKTGTLTENKMIFQRCTVGGVDYNHTSPENVEVRQLFDMKY